MYEERATQLPWVRQLLEKLNIESEIEQEIQRFCQKFGVVKEDLKIRLSSDRPFVNIGLEVPLDATITLKIVNNPGRTEKIDDAYKCYFDELSQKIAEKLAEIFQGEVKVIKERGNLWLTVFTPPDVIFVDIYVPNPYSDDC